MVKQTKTKVTNDPIEELAGKLEEGISQESAIPDPVTKAEEDHYARLETKIANERLQKLKHENAVLTDNREQRKLYAVKIYALTCGWITTIFVILFLQGWSIKNFHLSDNVLITLITSTTINFFAFFLLILRYLFNTGKTSSSIKKRVKSKKRGKRLF